MGDTVRGAMGIASLAMYPFESLRPAADDLWQAVRSSMPDLPPLAAWPGDPHADWVDPDLVVSQACGWPLVTWLAGIVRPVGTFRFRTPTWSGDHYRSVVIGREPVSPDADAVAAVNSLDSLSGWVSLVDWATAPGGERRWPGRTLLTGSHQASVLAVRGGEADVASIDAVTAVHLERAGLLDGLVVIGAGPLVPCLPLVCRADRDDAWVGRLRAALTGAAERTSPANAALMITGFSPLDAQAYAPLAALAPAT